MKYDTKENKRDQLNKGPLYNTEIYSKLHGTVFESYISNDRIDRYNLMRYISANDKILPTYVDDAISGGGI